MSPVATILQAVAVVAIVARVSGLAVADSPKATGHWAFVPPARPAVPAVAKDPAVHHPVDALVVAALQAKGVAPSPEATRSVLLRRISLDLTGLPPTVAEVVAFEADTDPRAYEKQVDRLLASPRFGERWGRHWLDLARYADSDGYEKDGGRPYAHRFRDWVIEALNRDVPFDRFTLEQLAGDLLVGPETPAETREERMAATGFHRQTLTNKEGGVDPEEDRVKQTVDRANATATVWLGLTVGCAECHDHKYDPLSQREYYQFYAFFNSVTETNVPSSLPVELAAYETEREAWAKRRAELESALKAAEPGAGASADAAAAVDAAKKAVAEHAKKEPAYPPRHIPALAELPTVRVTQVHRRGDFLQPAGEVARGTPRVLPALNVKERAPGRDDLARWLTDPSNPLVARVAVNRVWQQLFGFGLVRTPEDFGTRGEPPTHPELLDWLATELIRLEWSQKALIRTVVMSATYRQSSAHRPELAERDPENRWLARQNRVRLDAEAIRDSALAVGGLLDGRIGGPSVRPPLPADITDVAYAGTVKWPVSEGGDRYRRGLYTFLQRTVLYPALTAFDAPDTVAPCTRRERSNTPVQALALLNDVTFFECAQALAASVAGASDERVAAAGLVRRALGRPATGREIDRLAAYGRSVAAECGEAPCGQASRIAMARTVLNLEEFLTRE